ncbi:MAG TPA: serine hydrolase domain-containing protein [Thermoanaerobaculia bacterium]|nr:serine hydrolase domain-containing protein [Thermoanaerobaculia bacterium]
MSDPRASELQEAVTRLLLSEVETGSFPGASWLVGTSAGPVVEGAVGHAVLKPAKIPARTDTIYDVASLTKPLITTALVLQSAAEGTIDLSGRVAEHLTELSGTDKDEVTFLDLLTHRGGFQAWYPLYTHGVGDRKYLEALVKRPLRYRPGTRELYSCLGFITLTLALERIYGTPIEQLARERIFEPLGLTAALFNPAADLKYRIAATEWGNANERQMVAARNLDFKLFRNYMIWGEVNDANAWYMGGMAGNAGLFAKASDVFEISRQWLIGGGNLLPEEIVRIGLRNYTVGLEENRGAGWLLHMPRPDHPSAVLSERCYGHTGFTGTSVWVDPPRDLIMVLLTNRLHPYVKPLNMQATRREFHRIVAEMWD